MTEFLYYPERRAFKVNVFSRIFEYRRNVRLRHIIQVGILAEKRGNVFYKSLASRLSDPESKKVCLKIADDELDHQDLLENAIHTYRIKPVGDKIMRLDNQTAVIEAGRVFLPKFAPWLANFHDEVTKFPASKYDDQVDSLSQFLKWATTGRPKYWIRTL